VSIRFQFGFRRWCIQGDIDEAQKQQQQQ